MTNLTVERDNLLKMMQEWLTALGLKEGERLEVIFLPKEVIIRPQTPESIELDAWLDQATRKYDAVLRRLATS